MKNRLQIEKLAGFRRLPWKNGGGTTIELAIDPPQADFTQGAFRWRLSSARIEASGPFSPFLGFDRHLVLLSGHGLLMHHKASQSSEWNKATRLETLQPYQFSGDWASKVDLIDGPVTDFNVLVRRGEARANIVADRLSESFSWKLLGAEHFVYGIKGGIRLSDPSGQEIMLSPGELARVRASSDDQLRLESMEPGDSACLRVSIFL